MKTIPIIDEGTSLSPGLLGRSRTAQNRVKFPCCLIITPQETTPPSGPRRTSVVIVNVVEHLRHYIPHARKLQIGDVLFEH
mmetsp:Transcript_23303/g.64681  ORF Transcript_23303/g.64681 Transcript_23303/m.64681 type:complete len:81 (-) Transcript_23303:607-849(-)